MPILPVMAKWRASLLGIVLGVGVLGSVWQALSTRLENAIRLMAMCLCMSVPVLVVVTYSSVGLVYEWIVKRSLYYTFFKK